MVGLVTAGMLSRHFERVTLVERDPYEEGPHPRKGVPQSLQVHALLTRGLNILNDIFPGLGEELRAAGSRLFDATARIAAFAEGGWRPQYPSGIQLQNLSRPLLEWTVRQRLRALPQVRILDGREVLGLVMSPDGQRVTGVRLQAPGGEHAETLEGDLVLDASGRGSRMPQWLEALGYPRVEETHLRVNVGYATRAYRQPAGFDPGWDMLSIGPKLPEQRKLGILQPVEDGRWLVVLAGWLGDIPGADEAGFLEFARSLPQPHLYELLRNAEPLGPVHSYRFSHNQRRHYERMARFPDRLAVVGDAVCSFNPIYGQGMTTGALQAELLDQCLREGLDGASERYRRRSGKLLDIPWSLATGGDLRFPEVEGKRSPLAGLINWYGDRFQRLVVQDEEAMTLFVRVMHMLAPPSAMLAPRMALKALTVKEGAAPLPGPTLHTLPKQA